MFIVFDTETTGFPPRNGRNNENPKNYKKWNNCRIVQMSWLLCEKEGTVVKEKDYIIRPNKFTIPEVSTSIHGISTEKALNEGVKLDIVLEDFLKDISVCDTLVAHNINFDYDVVLSEIYRRKHLYEKKEKGFFDIKKYLEIEKYCTMLSGCDDGGRWPKLAALYEKYFNHIPDIVLHNSLNDTLLCKDIYMYQQKLLN